MESGVSRRGIKKPKKNKNWNGIYVRIVPCQGPYLETRIIHALNIPRFSIIFLYILPDEYEYTLAIEWK